MREFVIRPPRRQWAGQHRRREPVAPAPYTTRRRGLSHDPATTRGRSAPRDQPRRADRGSALWH